MPQPLHLGSPHIIYRLSNYRLRRPLIGRANMGSARWPHIHQSVLWTRGKTVAGGGCERDGVNKTGEATEEKHWEEEILGGMGGATHINYVISHHTRLPVGAGRVSARWRVFAVREQAPWIHAGSALRCGGAHPHLVDWHQSAPPE